MNRIRSSAKDLKIRVLHLEALTDLGVVGFGLEHNGSIRCMELAAGLYRLETSIYGRDTWHLPAGKLTMQSAELIREGCDQS